MKGMVVQAVYVIETKKKNSRKPQLFFETDEQEAYVLYMRYMEDETRITTLTKFIAYEVLKSTNERVGKRETKSINQNLNILTTTAA